MLERYRMVRAKTEKICQPLMIEDFVIAGTDDVSPPKWHLAHTTWFFETMILVPKVKGFIPFNRIYHDIFNSYYQGLGMPLPKPQRSHLSRPSVDEIFQYRRYVDEHMTDYMSSAKKDDWDLIELGLQHEQQHQELLLMDIKMNFSLQPNFPSYVDCPASHPYSISTNELFIPVRGGNIEIGHQGLDFCYDNELPRHRVYVYDFEIANRLVTNLEYLEFIESGGYQKPHLWLDDGWQWVQKQKISAPLYWYQQENQWMEYTLYGLSSLNMNAPVCHVSFYEAHAYATWRGKRLPTEFEWEYFASQFKDKWCLSSNTLHPYTQIHQPQQFMGSVWQWTNSSFLPYPGYQAYKGVLAEYNGKFMSNRFVLRGGCCWTPTTHLRVSYRNFYAPEHRWQLSGIRLIQTL